MSETSERDTLASRLEALEVRYSHQEAALEEMTRTLCSQAQTIKDQAAQIERLELALKSIEAGTASGSVGDEKPPHY